MNAIRILAVPALLIAVIAAYVAVNPGGTTVANPEATPTERPTRTPSPTATAAPPPMLPEGVSGKLTYRTGPELVTVQLPEATALARRVQTAEDTRETSADGAWYVDVGCDVTCYLNARVDGLAHFTLEYESVAHVAWSPAHERFAAAVRTLDGRNQFVLFEGEGAPQTRVLFESPDMTVRTFAWIDEGRLLVSTETHGAAALHAIDMSGHASRIADLASAAMWLHPAPDRSRFLYTQSNATGWRLHMLDVASMAVTDLGNMGSDPAGTTPPVESADGGKGPMYIAWSPDGTRVAFGGGFEPPYFMTTVDLGTGARARTEFPNGYPGEMKWSPDGSMIGVSTYDIERTHHETWVVDTVTGTGRHLMDGCVILWSPDGRFLAVHGEDIWGIAIVDVVTGERGQLTHLSGDVPVDWAP